MAKFDRPKIWASVGALSLAVITGGGGYLAAIGQRGVVQTEGGYVNDKNDAGGATNYGITEAVARAHGYTGSMRNLPESVAIGIYEQDYITAPRFDLILAASPAVGHKVVDAGVNVGTARAARWFQQSVDALSRGGRDYPRITIDGRIGPATMRAYAALERVRGRVKACELTLKAFDGFQAAHYTDLAQGPANSSFFVGWLDHRIGNVSAARCDEIVAGVQ